MINPFSNRIRLDGADIFFWVVACLALFWGLGSPSLWMAEDRWAEVAREMCLTGRFFHPTLNGEPYFDKPLLTYWLIVLVQVITGRLDEWAIRVPSAIAGLGSLWAARYLGRRLWSAQVARLAGWLLLTTHGFLFWSRTGMADMENVAAITLALAWYAHRRDRPGFSTFLLFYAILFGGAQLKGLAAVAVPILFVTPDLLRERRWRYLLGPGHFLALGAGIVIYLGPMVYAELTSDGYESSGILMAIRENILRFVKPFDHVEPVYVYLIYLPVLFFPWSPLLVLTLIGAVRRWWEQDSPTRSSMDELGRHGVSRPVRWIVTGLLGADRRWRTLVHNTRWLILGSLLIFLFFTVSGSRRSYYILPMLPPCALLLALILTAAAGEFWQRLGYRLLGIIFVGLAAVELAAVLAWPLARGFIRVEMPVSLLVSGAVVGGLALAPWIFRGALSGPLARLMGVPGSLAPPMVAALVLLGGFYCWQRPVLEGFRSTRTFALQVAATGRREEEIAFYGDKPRPGLLFYLNGRKPHPVLGDARAILEYFEREEGGGRRILLLRRRDLDQLQPSLPEGLQGEIVLEERVFPWNQHQASRRYLAWRLRADG